MEIVREESQEREEEKDGEERGRPRGREDWTLSPSSASSCSGSHSPSSTGGWRWAGGPGLALEAEPLSISEGGSTPEVG